VYVCVCACVSTCAICGIDFVDSWNIPPTSCHTYEWDRSRTRMSHFCVFGIEAFTLTLFIYDIFHWNATPPKTTESKNSDSLVSHGTDSNWKFGQIWICTEESELVHLVDFGGAAFSVESGATFSCHFGGFSNKSSLTYKWVMPHIRMSHATHINQSCHIYQSVMSHIWIIHVTYTSLFSCNDE